MIQQGELNRYKLTIDAKTIMILVYLKRSKMIEINSPRVKKCVGRQPVVICE